MSGEIRTIPEELALQAREWEDQERREFIREHASRMDAARCATMDGARHERLLFSAADCWKFARELWDAKPEDC